MDSVRALIFDVDGTMAETEELHRVAFNGAFAEFGLAWSWDRTIYKKLLAVTGGKERIAHFQNVIAEDRARLDASEIASLHRRKTARYVELMAGQGCPLRPGIMELIAAARDNNLALAIATTTSHANVAALLTPALGQDWAELFKVVVAGDDVKRKKPDPEVYLKVLQGLRLPASCCLAFEDSRNGLLSGQAAGIPVVISRSMYFDDEDFSGAFRVVRSLEGFDLRFAAAQLLTRAK